MTTPGRTELYEGQFHVRDGGRITVNLVCNCLIGRDPGGMPRHDYVVYDGTYAAQEVGGARIVLRQVDGAAVDTLERLQ